MALGKYVMYGEVQSYLPGRGIFRLSTLIGVHPRGVYIGSL